MSRKFRGAFGSTRVSASGLDARTATIAVHRSLFSGLQTLLGYEGSPAATIAWCLIKAARPAMTEHREAMVTLRELAPEEIACLRTVAVKTSKSEKMTESEARQALIGDILCILDSISAPAVMAGPVSMVVPAARSAERTAELIAAATAKPSRETLENETPDEKAARWGARLAAEKALETE